MADSSNAEKQVPTSTTGWSDNPNVNNWNETNKYLWNMEDWVGLIIPVDKMTFTVRALKK